MENGEEPALLGIRRRGVIIKCLEEPRLTINMTSYESRPSLAEEWQGFPSRLSAAVIGHFLLEGIIGLLLGHNCLE